MEPPETRYATTGDDLEIAYQLLGQGPPNLVWAPGFASHVELFWELPGFAHTFRRLASFSRLALFDKRGTGLSDRSLGTGALEDRMLDIVTVMNAAAFESAVLVSVSESAAMCALLAATHRERVDALIIIGGDVTGDWIRAHQGIEDTVREEWASGTLLRDLWLNGTGDLAQLGPIARAMGSPRAMAEMLHHNLQLDARPVLASISVPTLIVHCTGDPVVPVESGRYLAQHIPGARLVELPGAFHGSSRPEEMDLYVDEIQAFVTGARAPAQRYDARVLSTVLFTDIVGSTDRAAELGDERWARLLDDHDRVARGAVERWGGRWVKSTGDGILATFPGPARAVAAAQAIRRGVESLGIQIRAGIHTGEVEVRGDDIGGLGVHIAARVAAVAGAGEVLVSPTVPGLVVGSGLAFEERGEFELKGVPGSWRLSAVTSPAA